jgi:two-component system, LytTR family, response regulator
VGLKALIVDDEPLARDGLRLLLAADPAVAAIDEARDGREAVAAIRERRPDLVFLDVQMPEMDGFAVVEAIGAERMPAVVFVTAHDRYAIRAFEISALDYLLKPVTAERFAQALARVKERLRAQPAPEASRQIRHLLEAIAQPRRYLKRLAVRAEGKTFFVEVASIDWIEAAENYVKLHAGKTRHLLHASLASIEGALDPEIFVRVHRSAIVNLGSIRALEPLQHGEYAITLGSGARLRSGRSYNARVAALAANPF